MTEWDIRSWCWQPDLPVGQHYKVPMSVHCHKSVPVQIWPKMLLGRKTTNKTNREERPWTFMTLVTFVTFMPGPLYYWIGTVTDRSGSFVRGRCVECPGNTSGLARTDCNVACSNQRAWHAYRQRHTYVNIISIYGCLLEFYVLSTSQVIWQYWFVTLCTHGDFFSAAPLGD